MRNLQILNISFTSSIVVVIVGALFKIMHFPFAQPFLIAGVLAMVVFWFVAMYEIKSSTKIDASEKFMWFIGLIFCGSIAGLVYLLSGRKRIINNNQ
jgi:hypothetical protein